MPAFICVTCGVQYPPSEEPPQQCVICEDERQYIGWQGQEWTDLAAMGSAGHNNQLQEVEPGLTAILTEPKFAIGQRALLVQTDAGNFLWDCISYIDEETVRAINALGGVAGISSSHPHFYGSLVEWSDAFGEAPIYIPEADRQWVVRSNGALEWYEGVRDVLPGVRLVQCGGHFEGSAVLHWASGAAGSGALLTGDTIGVVQDRRWVTFMRSFPNYIPLSQAQVKGIVEALEPYSFSVIYGGWMNRDLRGDAKAAVRRSAERYISWIAR